MSGPNPVAAFERTHAALGDRYRLERIVAANASRVLFEAHDEMLKRRVSLRVNFYRDEPTRAWFLREAEALGRLDHPAIRHVYDAGVVGDLAYRIGNWIEGEGLAGGGAARPAEHPGRARRWPGTCWARSSTPTCTASSSAGSCRPRCWWTRAAGARSPISASAATSSPSSRPATHRDMTMFMAPEIRDGAGGDPACDVYTAGALLYFAVTGQVPPLDPRELRRPDRAAARPAPARSSGSCFARSSPAPEDRYLTAAEMLEDLASDAGHLRDPGGGGHPGAGAGQPRIEGGGRSGCAAPWATTTSCSALLGSGGFGRVYRVRDLHLEREVALKVLHPTLTQDPEVVERFRREAQLAARLSHPNIVNIYDIAGRFGLIWYTMELIDGPSLAQLVERNGPLPLEQVLRLLREALSALAHAHGYGLVHRDIKPENMLIDPTGSVQITDFGLALALRGKYGGATSQSGTPQFASPEQLLGERVDQRSDLYSLAAVVYYALLGTPPFPGATTEQVLARQTTNQFPAPRERRDDVPEALERVLDRALSADVESRYPSAAEFLQAVNRAAEAGAREPVADWARAAARWLRGSPLD